MMNKRPHVNREELALLLGNQILDAVYTKRFGNELVFPFKLPITSEDLDWVYTIRMQMPSYCYFDGEEFQRVTMAEYFGWGTHE